MNTEQRCPFCNAVLKESNLFCPACSAILPGKENIKIVRPKTIEEFALYSWQQKMPLEKMRFFVGVNYTKPKAFGVYRDGDRFIVYKNSDTGMRIIRYKGTDEEEAVGILFQKLMDECHRRGIYPDGKPAAEKKSSVPERGGMSGRLFVDERAAFDSSSIQRDRGPYRTPVEREDGSLRPRSIEALDAYCKERGVPCFEIGCYIGETTNERNAFGVYRSGTQYTVFINDPSGRQILRYRGPIESYAVGEVYNTILQRCHQRGIYPEGEENYRRQLRVKEFSKKEAARVLREHSWKAVIKAFFVLLFVGAFVAGLFAVIKDSSLSGNGYNSSLGYYYLIGNELYYMDETGWYIYRGNWRTTSDPGTRRFKDDESKVLGSKYKSEYGGSDITESRIYKEEHARLEEERRRQEEDERWREEESWGNRSYEREEKYEENPYDNWNINDTDWSSGGF